MKTKDNLKEKQNSLPSHSTTPGVAAERRQGAGFTLNWYQVCELEMVWQQQGDKPAWFTVKHEIAAL